MPCPAAFSVLLICIQLKEFTLDFAMVASFSIGLAITMVGVGLIAAGSTRHVEKRWRDHATCFLYIRCIARGHCRIHGLAQFAGIISHSLMRVNLSIASCTLTSLPPVHPEIDLNRRIVLICLNGRSFKF